MPESTPQPRRKRKLLKWVVVTFLVLTGLTVVGVPILLATGRTVGEEFTPASFDRRSFEYYELPGTGIQVFPIERRQVTGDLAAYLIADNLIATSPNQPPRWDLVWDNRTSPNSPDCDAAILCSYLDALNHDGERYWLAWSRSHPDSAKLLWPVVAELARQGDYISTPDAFEAATAARSKHELAKRLAELMQTRLTLLQQQADAAGDTELSDQLAARLAHWESVAAQRPAAIKPGKAAGPK